MKNVPGVTSISPQTTDADVTFGLLIGNQRKPMPISCPVRLLLFSITDNSSSDQGTVINP